MEEVGAQEVSLPALTAAGLWEKSGRLQLASAELMKVDDRHGKKYILAPVSDLMSISTYLNSLSTYSNMIPTYTTLLTQRKCFV